jgi:uncharacterized protein
MAPKHHPTLSGSDRKALTKELGKPRGFPTRHHDGGLKQHGIERFARAFAEDGFVVLFRDHRTFGASEEEPRQDIDPWRQIADWLSFLESRPDVDPSPICLWGTSYAGGHAIVLGKPTDASAA